MHWYVIISYLFKSYLTLLEAIPLSVKIITDSTAYLPETLCRDYDIQVVSLSVNFEVETFREVDIENTFFYSKMSKSKVVPTSSQPTLNELCQAFEGSVSQGSAVVGIFISSLMSGTYSTAQTARSMVLERYPDATIEIVDSLSNCMQLGFAVITAARAAKEGHTVEEILRRTEENIGKSRFLFVPDVLDYLKKGGRIGGAAALLGSILQIKPILTVVDGKTALYGRVRTKAAAIERIIKTFIDDIQKRGLGEVIVHHIHSEDEGNRIAETLSHLLDQPVPVYPIGPVIGLHVGPGTVGLVYYTR